MLTNFRFFAALCLVLGLQALALRLTSPGRDAQWKTGNRETVSWEVSCSCTPSTPLAIDADEDGRERGPATMTQC